jgi:hypothetical protein
LAVLALEEPFLNAKLLRRNNTGEILTIDTELNVATLPEFISTSVSQEGAGLLHQVPTSDLYCKESEMVSKEDYHTFKYLIVCPNYAVSESVLFYFTTKSLVIRIKDKQTIWIDSYLKNFDFEQNLEVGGSTDDISKVNQANYIEVNVRELPVLMKWCEEHPKMCEKIADNGHALYTELITKELLMENMAVVFDSISKKSKLNLESISADSNQEYIRVEHLIKTEYLPFFLGPGQEQKKRIESHMNILITVTNDIEHIDGVSFTNLIIRGNESNVNAVMNEIDISFTNMYVHNYRVPLKIEVFKSKEKRQS